MFKAKKYLKIKELETVLYGGPEAAEFNYEKEASYKGDNTSRSRDSFSEKYEDESSLSTKDIEPKEDETWYKYEYDSEKNKVFFTLQLND